MATEEYPEISELRQLLEYCPDTGRFWWNPRDVSLFSDGKQSAQRNCAIWNGKFSRKETGKKHSDGYCHIRIYDRLYLAHHIAWAISYGEWPKTDIDHENMDRGDNRIRNLRLATRSQNMGNTKAHSDNLCGVKGVSMTSSGKYCARLYVRGKNVLSKTFETVDEAASAYAAAAREHFGEYARAGQ